jgi:hypothetical protein
MDISRTLQKLCPNCSYCVNGNSYEGIIWQDETIEKPTLQEIVNAWDAIKNDIIWETTRNQRNKLLQECDYTQLPDYTKSDKEDWAIYRNKLRDIPQTWFNPDLVIWPQKPN